MSSVARLIQIFETVLSARGHTINTQIVGLDFSQRCIQWFGCDYLQFASDYNDLIDQIRDDIQSIEFLKDEKKDEYIKLLNPARGIFAPEALVGNWSTLWAQISDGHLTTFLSTIAGFLDHDAGIVNSKINRSDILKSINELDEIINSSDFNKENKIICSLYIDNLRNIIKNELSFKDRKILKEYEALISRSIALHAISDVMSESKIPQWVKKSIDILNTTIRAGKKIKEITNLAKDIGLLG